MHLNRMSTGQGLLTALLTLSFAHEGIRLQSTLSHLIDSLLGTHGSRSSTVFPLLPARPPTPTTASSHAQQGFSNWPPTVIITKGHFSQQILQILSR